MHSPVCCMRGYKFNTKCTHKRIEIEMNMQWQLASQAKLKSSRIKNIDKLLKSRHCTGDEYQTFSSAHNYQQQSIVHISFISTKYIFTTKGVTSLRRCTIPTSRPTYYCAFDE